MVSSYSLQAAAMWAAEVDGEGPIWPSMKDAQVQVEVKVQSKLKQYKCRVYKTLGQHT